MIAISNTINNRNCISISNTFLLTLSNINTNVMAKESAHLFIRLSPKLKSEFKTMCEENEIDMSDKVRELIANLVRSHKRQTPKASD